MRRLFMVRFDDLEDVVTHGKGCLIAAALFALGMCLRGGVKPETVSHQH